MHSIENLRGMVGLSTADAQLIHDHKLQLATELSRWEQEFEDWFREHAQWQLSEVPSLHVGFLESFVCGQYDEDFHALQYHQGLHWATHGVGNGGIIAALSRIRQYFITLSEHWGQIDLARALCRVVDISQTIQGTVSQLDQNLQRLKEMAEQDISRVQRSCGSVVNERNSRLVKAYTDHFRWKLRAYSLALGDPIREGEVPLSHHECELGRWLDAGGFEQIPEEQRDALDRAHARLHEVMRDVLNAAHSGRPHHVVPYLLQVEAASEEIAEILGHSIEREVLQLAAEDVLTRLGNRRMFEQELARRKASARRQHKGFGLLFIDLDHFKRVNDNHGHTVGDEVLRQTAARLRAQLRGADAAYRWGGEEFAALVAARDPGEVARLAERLRDQVERSAMPVAEVGASVSVTLSIGGSYFDPEGADAHTDTLFLRVDRALHQAKQDGRNRVVIY